MECTAECSSRTSIDGRCTLHVREADRPHEWEPERGNIDDRGPCAICGMHRGTQAHRDGEALEAAEREGEEAFMRRNPGVL